MRIDLHCHTVFSDGILDPESLVALAFAKGVRIFSVTDHDCVDAIPAARKKAEELGMAFISGVELNTDWKEGEVHILGYCFDPANHSLQKKLLDQRNYRQVRLREMLDKLKILGFELDESRVLEIAGSGSAGRPHLALALMEKKYVETVEEAFQKYLGYGKPGWAPRNRFTPKEAIQSILEAGGIAVLAHPGRGGSALIDELVKNGLGGIEVYYPSHTEEQEKELLWKARKYDLLVTAGSDFHGINPGEKGPGSIDVPEKVIENIERILKRKNNGAIISSKP